MTFQLGAPLLDACVLAALSRGDAYGYSLTQRMKQVVELSESTLYPVLRRLQQGGCLDVYKRQTFWRVSLLSIFSVLSAFALW